MIRGKRVFAFVRRFVRRIFVRPVRPLELSHVNVEEMDLTDVAALQDEIRLMLLELEARVIARE